MHRTSAIASPIELYAQQQRQRMEAIRAATERERELLNERLVAAADGVRVGAMGAASPAPHHHTSAAIGGSSPAPYTAAAARTPFAAEKALVLKEREEIRARAETLSEAMAALRRAEHTMAAEEAEVDRRLQRAADRKRDLLAQLKAIQLREEDLTSREAAAAAKEEALRRQSEDVRVRQRDSLAQLATVKAEVSQREVLFVAALKKQSDRAADNDRALQRLRQQAADMEGRVRALDMQLGVRARAIDDMERDTMRAEMTLRDEELHTIEGLRRDIENRRAALATRELAALFPNEAAAL